MFKAYKRALELKDYMSLLEEAGRIIKVKDRPGNTSTGS